MAVITDAKVWSWQQIRRGSGLIPELAHMGSAKVAGNEAVNDHDRTPVRTWQRQKQAQLGAVAGLGAVQVRLLPTQSALERW